jgi:hypothetical protein
VSPSRRPGPGRSLVYALVAVSGVVFLGSCALEVGARLVAPQVLVHDAPELWEPDPRLAWRHVANARVVTNTGERSVEVCTDAAGDRGSCRRAGPRDCRARGLVIGDSFTEALSVPWEDTAWSLLEADTGACLAVAGVGAYYLSQYVATAERRLAPGQEPFDAVIVNFYVGNDFTDDASRIPPLRDVQRLPFRALPASFTPQGVLEWLYPWNQWLESRSHAYVGLRAAFRSARRLTGLSPLPTSIQRSRLTPEVVRESAAAVARIHALAAARGARTILCLIPEQEQALDPGAESFRFWLAGGPEAVDMDLPQKVFLPRVEEVEGLTVVDLLPRLRESADPGLWGRRDVHLSPRGHRVWFEALREPVREALGVGAEG